MTNRNPGVIEEIEVGTIGAEDEENGRCLIVGSRAKRRRMARKKKKEKEEKEERTPVVASRKASGAWRKKGGVC